jgi:hypothetical protein
MGEYPGGDVQFQTFCFDFEGIIIEYKHAAQASE